MRTFTFLLVLVLGWSVTFRLQAQDPGAQQDAEAAREKLLKAEDELENIQANSETTTTAVDGMKTDVTKLQSDVTALQADNATLKQQVADLQAAFAKAEADRAKERQVLLDEVAKMVAAGSKTATKTTKKKTPPADNDTPPPAPPSPEETNGPASTATSTTNAAPADTTASTGSTTGDAGEADTPPPVKTQKGYYHIVASGETLTLICKAYREDGVHVTVAQIRKANGLTAKSVLQVGQKLFIPKPGA